MRSLLAFALTTFSLALIACPKTEEAPVEPPAVAEPAKEPATEEKPTEDKPAE